MARLIGNVDATGSLTTPNVTIDTSNTLLYLPLDADTNDDSPEAQSITNSGVTISSTQSKFGGYSGYFDGSSFMQVAYDASLGGTAWMHGDYTLEAWLYPTDASSEKTIFSRWDAATANRQFVLKMNTNRTLTWEMRNVGDYTTSNTITLNSWSHVAVSESSGVVRCFINGVQGFQQTVGNANSVDRYIDIGRREPGGATRYFVGYMDDVRWLSSGIYTAAFTPVTSSYGAGVETITNDTRTFSSVWNLNSPEVTEAFKAGTWPTNIDTQYTLFYASFDTNANDESAAGLTATLSGNANIQSSTAKFGSALDVDGSGDFVTYSDGVALGATDFTIEHWLYLNTTSSGNEVLVANYLNSSVKGWMWRLFGNNANSLGFSYNDGAWRHFYVNSSIITNNQWHHVACVYDQSAHSMAIYLDGVAQTVVTSNVGSEIGAAARDTNVLTISKLDGYTQEFDGQMDDLMILNTKRYTANFTVPTAASGGGI